MAGGQARVSNRDAGRYREGDPKKRGQWIQGGRKCCLVDRDHFRPVVPAERNPVAWQPQPQNITSTGRWLSGGRWDNEGERGREGGLNGYILISFVHPQKLSSVPLRCSRRVVLGLVSFRERSGIVPHATFANTFVPKTPGVNLPRNANTCATNQCLPRAAEATRAHTSSRIRFGQRGPETRGILFHFIYQFVRAGIRHAQRNS